MLKFVSKVRRIWARFWLGRSGPAGAGRIAYRLAAWFTPPYYARVRLSRMHPKGYISPRATLHHGTLQLGKHCYIDDGVLIYRDQDGGAVELGDGVHIHRDTIIQTGREGEVFIGADTHIQPRCQISAYEAPVRIGKRVEIAPNCAFYPYDHATTFGLTIREQPLQTKGGIIIEDDVWLGFGVVVLDGVTIGKGAVIGAGAVVVKDIPDSAIAAGVPARVVKMRRKE